jgi:2-iminobutanoate/2-iminopropanoate deaminase
MSELRVVQTLDAPRPMGAYSQGITVGPFVFTAGQGPIDHVTGAVVGTTVAEQTVATLSNIVTILAAVGASLREVVKVTAYLRELALFPDFDRTYGAFFGEWRPARTTVGCQLNGILVEIDAVAYLGAAGYRSSAQPFDLEG